MDNYWEIELERHRLAATLIHSSDADTPVFFLHGIGGSIYFWTPQLTAPFHDVGPCYSLSLPGHFPAAFPKGFPTDCLTAELVARLVSHAIQKIVGNRKVLLVGHSTGGFAAVSTAIHHPEVVAGIVSIAGFAKGQWTGALGLSQWLVRRGPTGCAIFKRVYKLGGSHPAIFRMYWQAYVSDHTSLLKNPPFERVTDCMLPHFRKLDLDALVSYFAVMPKTDITPDLSKISAPTCLITGNKDPIVPSKQSVTIAKKVNNSKLAILKGAGHLPFFERPVEYKTAIETWLTEFSQGN
jgi:pimeloyl-ACP methyl ester carboxylesterase